MACLCQENTKFNQKLISRQNGDDDEERKKKKYNNNALDRCK